MLFMVVLLLNRGLAPPSNQPEIESKAVTRLLKLVEFNLSPVDTTKPFWLSSSNHKVRNLNLASLKARGTLGYIQPETYSFQSYNNTRFK